MKTLFRPNKHVLIFLGVVGSAALVAFPQQSAMAASKGKATRKVEITRDTIVIHPVVRLSAADAQAMDNILKKNAKTLYKIDAMEKGKMAQTEGMLSDANMTAALQAEIAKAGKQGQSLRTAQVVCPAPCNKTQIMPLSTILKATDPAARAKLIQELKPILEKY